MPLFMELSLECQGWAERAIARLGDQQKNSRREIEIYASLSFANAHRREQPARPLSTILDDFSRYIIAWKRCTIMKAEDVTKTLQLALTASGCDQARVVHKPRLLSDNRPGYVSGELAKWLDEQDMAHVRGAPNHPQTQGKIERWHQSLKNRILLENYYLRGDLEACIGR